MNKFEPASPTVAGTRPGRHALARRLGGLVLAAMTLWLAACGFELRKPPEFAFRTIYAEVAPTSTLGVELKRNLHAMSNVQLFTDFSHS